jgi:hypothetical protein
VFAGVLLEQTFSRDELAEIRSFVSVQRDDCFFYLNKISDDAQFNAVINVCDVLFAMYDNFLHSSNLVTKSALFGKRILVSSGGYMQEVVRRYKLGEAVPAGDVTAALTALHRLTATPCSPEALAGMQEYAREQSQEKLQQVMLGAIEHATNCLSSERSVPFREAPRDKSAVS